MKPVKLEFKGLNSFSERAEIDFGPLLQSGIFGIFGETGSGKSTILDAINFALYGDIERNPDKIDKINYKCDELDVKFTFDIFTEGSRRTYLVERNIKRKSGTHKAMLYELSGDGSSRAVADNVKTVNDKITEIIGINKEDFRKCIALPQGEFAQFVNSAPSDRIELIERLFNLQKYGKALKEKLAARERAAQTQYAATEGELRAYDDDTKERLNEIEQRAAAFAAAEEGLKAAATAAEEAYNRESALLKQKQLYAAAIQRLEKLKERKPEFDELGKVLPALSGCERACAEKDKADVFSVRAEKGRAEAENISARIEKTNAELEKVLSELKDGDLDGRAEELSRKCALMESMLPNVSMLSSRNAELKRCREQYSKELSVNDDAFKQCGEVTADLCKAHTKLKQSPDIDIGEYIKSQFRGGILKEEYARALVDIKMLRAEIRAYDDNSALYEFVCKELDKKAEEYKSLILSVKNASLVDVNAELRRLDKMIKMRRDLEVTVQKLDGDMKTASIKLRASNEKLAELKERGTALAAEVDELKGKVAEVFGSDDAATCRQLSDAKNRELEDIRKKKSALTEKSEELRRLIGEDEKRRSAKEAEIKAACEQREAAERAAAQCVAEAGMENIEACRALIKRYTGYKSALEKYNNFNTEYSKAEGEAKSARPAEGAENVTESTVAEALGKKNETAAALSRNSSELAVAKKEAESLKSRLRKKGELEQKFKEIKRECDLLSKLKSLLRDNKFMEYIANEHLVNISRAASRTLIELTDGRYYLAYTDNNFCVGDNYNGGEMRKVKTLSGGETFLVSLSLALALSATICSRSLKSIEFFFLDEGFGTLDGDLIDTVLNALEKLKNENFSIGLISHVEELKHRISSKILVSKATESHGSTIRISC